MIERTFYVHIFDCTVHVCFTKEVVRYAKKYLKQEISEESAHAITYCFEKKGDEEWQFIVALPEEFEPNTTFHEALHCAYDILAHVEVKVEHDNHEVLAYLQEYIYEQLQILYTKDEDDETI
tara:strand:- start:219 stop:584 length:366 start_codon:yes stop_codon:yes gene_type:complete